MTSNEKEANVADETVVPQPEVAAEPAPRAGRRQRGDVVANERGLDEPVLPIHEQDAPNPVLLSNRSDEDVLPTRQVSPVTGYPEGETPVEHYGDDDRKEG